MRCWFKYFGFDWDNQKCMSLWYWPEVVDGVLFIDLGRFHIHFGRWHKDMKGITYFVQIGRFRANSDNWFKDKTNAGV